MSRLPNAEGAPAAPNSPATAAAAKLFGAVDVPRDSVELRDVPAAAPATARPEVAPPDWCPICFSGICMLLLCAAFWEAAAFWESTREAGRNGHKIF